MFFSPKQYKWYQTKAHTEPNVDIVSEHSTIWRIKDQKGDEWGVFTKHCNWKSKGRGEPVGQDLTHDNKG